MGLIVPGVTLTAVFLLLAWSIFNSVLATTNDQTDSLRVTNELQLDRLKTLVSISSDRGCKSDYVVTADNLSKGVSFGDFSEIDVIVRYLNTTADDIVNRLAFSTDWTASISGDTTNPNVWDPGEKMAIFFTLTPDRQPRTLPIIGVTVPGGVSDTAYLAEFCHLFWYNDPTPPVADTASHAVLTADTTEPIATTLFNYDTDRDACAGLVLGKTSAGLAETDTAKFQRWTTASLTTNLLISGDVTVDFWAAMKDFADGKAGEVTIFLRDLDESGSYTEISSGTVSDSNWQGGPSAASCGSAPPLPFVEKTITMAGLSYNVAVGHQLEARVIVVDLGSEDDMWFAYDTVEFPSRVNLP